MHECRLRSEAKVHSGHPVAHLGLGKEVGSGEVAPTLPTLPEAVDLRVDSTVVVDRKEIASAERNAGTTGPQHPSDVIRGVEREGQLAELDKPRRLEESPLSEAIRVAVGIRGGRGLILQRSRWIDQRATVNDATAAAEGVGAILDPVPASVVEQ